MDRNPNTNGISAMLAVDQIVSKLKVTKNTNIDKVKNSKSYVVLPLAYFFFLSAGMIVLSGFLLTSNGISSSLANNDSDLITSEISKAVSTNLTETD